MDTNRQNFISINDFTKEELLSLLQRSAFFKKSFMENDIAAVGLEQCIVVHAFFENSTRTKNSFEIAATRLGMKNVSFNASTSSLSKGESLFDTLQTLDAMHPSVVVMRNSYSGACDFAVKNVQSSIVNAGDGKHGHPTQALLDAMTLQEVLGDLTFRKIGIIGDLLHSRVFRSNVQLLTKLGATVLYTGPNTLVPTYFEHENTLRVPTLHELLENCDAVIALRLQKERMGSGLVPSLGEYSKYFGLKNGNVSKYPQCFVLHPGPVNYGVEIDFEVANGSQSLIRQQVENGVFVRMSVLEHCVSCK